MYFRKQSKNKVQNSADTKICIFLMEGGLYLILCVEPPAVSGNTHKNFALVTFVGNKWPSFSKNLS